MMSPEQLELLPLGGVQTIKLPPKPTLQNTDPLRAAWGPFTTYMRQREFSEHTISAFLNDLDLLADYLGPETLLIKCTTPRLEEFVHHLQYGRGVPCSGKSLDRRITTLKVFFGWLAQKNILHSDPAAPLIHHQARSPLPQILNDKQLAALLDTTRSMRDADKAPDARPHLLVSLILDTAIKKAECMNIALAQIDVSDPAQPTVYINYDKPRQRFKIRRLALGAEWTKTLERYLRRYQPRTKLFECTPRNLEYMLHTVSLVAVLPFPLTFEMLRWTSAVRSLKAGMAEEHLRKRLGLSRISWEQTLPILKKLAEWPL
jgi:site-specific recombinase XerD